MKGPSHFQPDDSQAGKKLEVARIGGGPSAKVGALVVAVVLVGVIGIGIAGRPPAPPAVAATPAAVVAEATPAPTAVDPTTEPTAQPTPARAPRLDTYGVSLQVGEIQYEVALDSFSTTRLYADIRVPERSVATGVLDFTELSSLGSVTTVKSIREWTISLDPLTEISRDRVVVLDVQVPARPKQLNVPPPIRRGYHLTVYARSDLLFGVITMEVTMGPVQGITGDDGLIGWPGAK